MGKTYFRKRLSEYNQNGKGIKSRCSLDLFGHETILRCQNDLQRFICNNIWHKLCRLWQALKNKLKYPMLTMKVKRNSRKKNYINQRKCSLWAADYGLQTQMLHGFNNVDSVERNMDQCEAEIRSSRRIVKNTFKIVSIELS